MVQSVTKDVWYFPELMVIEKDSHGTYSVSSLMSIHNRVHSQMYIGKIICVTYIYS